MNHQVDITLIPEEEEKQINLMEIYYEVPNLNTTFTDSLHNL